MQGKNGTTHHLILGFGIVSCREVPEKAIVVTKSNILGASVSNSPGLKFNAGYASSTVVQIADGAEDVRVEVSKYPGKDFTVDVQKAVLKPKRREGEENDEKN